MEDFLKSQGVTDIKPCATQGFMSKVYVGLKEGNSVIVHHTYPNEEQVYQNIKDKIIFSASLLSKEGFPCSPIISSKDLSDGSFVLVQKLLEGTPFGKREFDGSYFHDSYDEQYIDKLMDLIKNIHKIKLSGFGQIKEGVGIYETWRDFLRIESARWIDNVYSNKPETMNEADKKLIGKVVERLLKHPATNQNESCFLTGDIVNPGNVLVKNGEISGVVDFEWALAGDPAWEFAFTDMPIDKYIELAGVEADSFRERVKVCRFFWLLWGTNVHAKGEFKPVLYRLLKEEVQYWTDKSI